MKFYCDNCNAKYLISDEKVRGKVLKIRCKTCNHVMVVREPTQPVAEPPSSRALREGGGDGVEWFYAVAGQTYGPFALKALQSMFAQGTLGDEAHVWNATFTAWLPAVERDEFRAYFQQGTVRKPRRPTMSLLASDVQAAMDESQQRPASRASGVLKPARARRSSSLPALGDRGSLRDRLAAKRSGSLSSPDIKARGAGAAAKGLGAGKGLSKGKGLGGRPLGGKGLGGKGLGGKALGGGLGLSGAGGLKGASKPGGLVGRSGAGLGRAAASAPSAGGLGSGSASTGDRLRILRDRMAQPESPEQANNAQSLKDRLKQLRAKRTDKPAGAAPPADGAPGSDATMIAPAPAMPEGGAPGSDATMIAPAPAMPEPAAAQPAPSIDALFGGGPGALDPGLDQPFANARPAASAVLPGGSGRPSLGGGAAPAVDPMLADTLESAKSPEVADAIAKARAEDQALAQREAEAKAKAAREAAEAQAKRDAAEAKAKREEDERALAQKEAEERARRAAEAQAKRAAKAEERRKAKAAAESAAAKSSDVNADLFSAFDNASKPDPKPDKGSAGPDPNPHLQDSFFPPALENDPAAEVDDEPTPSLLIQLGEIEKNKRQQATKGAIIAVAFILVVAVGLSVYLFVFAGKNDRVAELQEQVASGKVEADKKRGKHFDFSKRKGYSRDQLADMTFVDLGEDDETLKDEPEDAPSEGNPKGKGDAAAKGSKPAPRAGKPIAAKGAAASGTPTKDTAAAKSAPAAKDGGKDDGKAKNLLGVKVDLKSSGSALDKGLDGAKSKAEGKDPKGIAALSSASNDTGATGKKASLEGAAAQKDPAKAGDNASVYNTLFKGTRKVSKVEVEKRKVDPGQSAPTIPSTLTRADLLAGFKSVRRSAFQCVERHLKRSGELPAGKVQVTVTIEGNGRVTGLNMTPPSLKNSVFDSCMRSKRSAWRFPLFQGAPIQVSRKFVLK